MVPFPHAQHIKNATDVKNYLLKTYGINSEEMYPQQVPEQRDGSGKNVTAWNVTKFRCYDGTKGIFVSLDVLF